MDADLSRIKVRMGQDLVTGIMIDADGRARLIGRHGLCEFTSNDQFARWMRGEIRVCSPNFVQFAE